ncbi:S9 family peptidase [Asticcacaulis sp. BYS171W]|uniref:S9 family peptidase n=1 Tax=Asticcacaulis aquaticus TaxID=2984212 RepID=A0ABT5HTU4_9CAUL|nr:S9 family peptidase [Asticcacaulis aquaticus]MDC7683491.1 S9 family peptidase [Asticcacaulis aquaticus]
MRIELDRRQWLAGIAGVSVMTLSVRADAAETPAAAEKTVVPPRPELEVYVRKPDISDVSLSPDARHIALITLVEGKYVLLIHEIATQKNKTIWLGESKVRSVFWGDNEHVVVFTTSTVGLREFTGARQEHSQAHYINIATSKLRTLFDRMESFYNTVEGDLYRIKQDGKYYVTASNYFLRDDYGLVLYRFDLATGKAKQLDAGDNGTRRWVLTPAGVPVARCDYDRDRKEWRLQMRNDKGIWKEVFKQKEAIDYPSLVGLGRDEKSVIIYIDAGDNAGEYIEIRNDGTLSEPLDKDGYNRGPMFHPTTKLFAGFARWDDWVTYEYNDPQLKRLAEACKKAMPDYNVSIYEFAAEDPRKVIIYGESPDDPGTYYFIDFSNGDYIPVGANYPDLPTQWITQKKPVTYKAADGLDIHGYLTLPPRREAKNLPLIVLPHGGPHARDTSGFDWEAQLYASRGYAVLQPNFRGSTGYGSDFVEAGYGQWGRKMQTDLSDGVRYLVKDGLVDPKRVCIVGASYGGYAALAGVTLDPGVYNCAVSVAGISDIKAMLEFDSSQSGSSTSPVVLSLKRSVGDRKTLDQISPIKFVDKVTVPVLLIHGKDDIVVDIGQSRKMERALKSAGKDVTFIELKGEDHWSSVEARRLEMSTAIVAFLEKHNPPG